MVHRRFDEIPEPLEASSVDEAVAGGTTRRRVLQGLGAVVAGGVAWIAVRESGTAQVSAADHDDDDDDDLDDADGSDDHDDGPDDDDDDDDDDDNGADRRAKKGTKARSKAKKRSGRQRR